MDVMVLVVSFMSYLLFPTPLVGAFPTSNIEDNKSSDQSSPYSNPTNLGHHRAPCDIQQLPISCFTHGMHISVNPNLPINLTLPFPSCVYRSILYVCVSIPALEIVSLVLFF